MKKVLILIVLLFSFSCSSVHEVKFLDVESWDTVDLCVFYVQKTNKEENVVYKIATSQYDSLSIPLKKVNNGDIVKLKLLKVPQLRMSKYRIEKDRYFVINSNDSLIINEDYYTPDIEGLYYIKLR